MKKLTLLASLLLVSCEARTAPTLEGTNHEIGPGENLFLISERAYGNGLEWPRIWEANPWLDPERLRPGEVIHIPRRANTWGDPPPRNLVAHNVAHPQPSASPLSRLKSSTSKPSGATRQSANPGKKSGAAIPGLRVFHNFASQVSSKTLFGYPLEQTLLILLVMLIGHALIQSLFLWLAANLTFVKEASMKKATRAVLQTEFLTFSTLATVGFVGVVLLYLGKGGAGAEGNKLLPALENFMATPTGSAVVGGGVFLLYSILSLRFIPAAFGLRSGRAVPLTFLAVLAPHVAAFYLWGQRMGWI